MSILENKFTSILSSVALVALVTGLTPVRAQELSEDLVDEVDEIVVTGSRLKRSSYNSATPVQIISGEVARELGLFDVTSILQGTSQSSGLQVNNSFTSFVLDNGIGAATIGFRGLGAERTLILINGRRLTPAGVGGAPSAPDINMIPAALIERIDNVFDGASAVYGSDAIAGVSNVILRTDIEGIELQTSGSKPASGGGEEFSFTGLYGKSGDNWNISVATTYYERQSQSFAQNDFFNACDEYRFEDESGNLLTQYRGLAPGTTDSSCRLNTTNRVSIRDGIFGNVWSTPGTTNIGIPNFSETVIGPGLAPFAPPGTVTQIDSNGDGILDPEFLIDPDQNGLTEVDIQSTFFNLDRSERSQSGDLLTGSKLFTVYGTGYYNFQDDNDTELYFEAMYNVRKTKLFSPGSQFFPTVPATNPFNITNPDGQGVNSLNFFGVDFGAFEVIPIISIRGDRDLNDVEVSQKRMLAGIKGNISKFDTFLGGNWSYDVNVGYTTSTGTDVQQGIHDDRLELSLNTTIEDPNSPGTYICGVDNDGDGVPDGTDGCVPFAANAASLFR
ncbi:MAG: TonB-dependent receptor, partial [Kordiimonadaceae bacterium]|nr:TonB-dependent receptor [Kordiimonadaceae bacterium]